MSHMKDFAMWCDEVGLRPTSGALLRYQAENRICKRCLRHGQELFGLICGNCGDDLRESADADRAEAEHEAAR